MKHYLAFMTTGILLALLLTNSCSTGSRRPDPPGSADTASTDPDTRYQSLKNELMQGWNTWDNRSIMTHVLLPEGLAVVLGLESDPGGAYSEHFFTGNRVPGTERVRTHAHTPDGSFTHFTMNWKNMDLRVRTASEDDDLYIIVTPAGRSKGSLHVRCDMPYGDPGTISREENRLTANLPGNQSVTIFANGTSRGISERQTLQYDLNNGVYLSTRDISPEEIKTTIDAAEKQWQEKKRAYGPPYSEPAEVYSAIQNAVNWLVVYDPEKDRLVTPVARTWAYGWGNGNPGGYVLFCWDNFFAAWMHSIESKALAYNEAIQMCNHIDELGFVPNYAGPGGIMSRDRSQPPVGSMCVKKIYQRHPEKWFLEHTFDKLLTWNRWWKEHRDNDGLLTWGSTPFQSPTGDKRELVQNEFRAASNESGLDNTPMYDGVGFDTTTHMLRIQDVGLTGLYIMDCEALAYIAGELGRVDTRNELLARAQHYRQNLQPLWDEAFGLFLNRHPETGKLSKRISPTNFYALNGETATRQQAGRMIAEHFYNPDEFWGEYILPSAARNDTAYTGHTYWRGSIWAPMNLLVYWGMQNYDLPEAREDLAEKSKNLLLKNWHEKGWIRENYHAETGSYNPRSEHFYHWGALLGMIYLSEEGYLEKPPAP